LTVPIEASAKDRRIDILSLRTATPSPTIIAKTLATELPAMKGRRSTKWHPSPIIQPPPISAKLIVPAIRYL
jgi:hypothetical protein